MALVTFCSCDQRSHSTLRDGPSKGPEGSPLYSRALQCPKNGRVPHIRFDWGGHPLDDFSSICVRARISDQGKHSQEMAE